MRTETLEKAIERLNRTKNIDVPVVKGEDHILATANVCYKQGVKDGANWQREQMCVEKQGESPFPTEEIQDRIRQLENTPLLEQFKALFSNMPCELRELKAKECVEIAERFAKELLVWADEILTVTWLGLRK